MPTVVDIHAAKNERGSVAPEGASHECLACGRTCTAAQVKEKRGAVNPTRRTYADVAAEELHAILGADRGTWQAWADRLGITRQVAQRFGELGGPRVTVGDVLLAPAESAIAYLEALTRRLKGLAPRTAPAPPATIDETLHHARGEIADVDKVLIPGAKHGVETLRRAKKEAHESVVAAQTLEAHIDDLLARAARGGPEAA